MSVSDQNKPEEKNAVWETIVVLFQAFLLAAVIRTVLLQPFTIPSGSMIPTLLVGDYLLVNKFSYGYSRYSLPVYNPEWFKGRLFGSEPTRGDVVVFRLPSDPSIDYIKRVVGLPGDKLQVIDGVLNINGKPVPRVAEGSSASTNMRMCRSSAKRSIVAQPTRRSTSTRIPMATTPRNSSCRPSTSS